jgi:hypothetical protein
VYPNVSEPGGFPIKSKLKQVIGPAVVVLVLVDVEVLVLVVDVLVEVDVLVVVEVEVLVVVGAAVVVLVGAAVVVLVLVVEVDVVVVVAGTHIPKLKAIRPAVPLIYHLSNPAPNVIKLKDGNSIVAAASLYTITFSANVDE